MSFSITLSLAASAAAAFSSCPGMPMARWARTTDRLLGQRGDAAWRCCLMLRFVCSEALLAGTAEHMLACRPHAPRAGGPTRFHGLPDLRCNDYRGDRSGRLAPKVVSYSRTIYEVVCKRRGQIADHTSDTRHTRRSYVLEGCGRQARQSCSIGSKDCAFLWARSRDLRKVLATGDAHVAPPR